MKIAIFPIVIFLTLQLTTISCSDEETNAKALVQEMQAVVRNSIPQIRNRNANDASPDFLLRKNVYRFYPTLKNIKLNAIQNTELRQQIKRLLRGSYYPPISVDLENAIKHLKEVPKAKWACAYKNRQKCSMAYVPNIKSVFAESQDLDELIYYWVEWRNKTTQEVKNSLLYLISYYQNSTNYGISKPSDLWYYGYDSTDFMAELEEVMASLRPFYLHFHGFLRHELNKKYGDSIVPPRGLIPYHLIEKAELQSWKKESIFQNPFPESKLPNLQAELDSLGYTPLKIVKKSAEFFGSLGMTNLTDDFWQKNVRAKERGGPDCKSDIFELTDVYLDYCPKSNFKKLLQTHGDMGRVLYAVQRNKLQLGLNEEPCPGFANAIGEAAILSASSPKHIKKLGLLDNYDYDDETSLNRLFRQAIHTLLTIPEFFVHEKLWVEMIDGKIRPHEYNCEYWKLMEHYAGIEPPVHRTNDDLDFPHKFYEGIVAENGHTRKIISEFLGYQLYRAICEKSGEFVRGNAYKPLQNCDFFQKREAGNHLSDIISKGSKESWRDIMKPVVDLGKLNAAALLEFFEPLHVFFEEENFKNNVIIGWTPSNSSHNGKTSTCAITSGKLDTGEVPIVRRTLLFVWACAMHDEFREKIPQYKATKGPYDYCAELLPCLSIG